jgi:hypothetical protein
VSLDWPEKAAAAAAASVDPGQNHHELGVAATATASVHPDQHHH